MKRDLETAQQVRRTLEIACGRLGRPTVESMDAATGELSAAVRTLESLQVSLKSRGAAEGSASALAHEIRAIRQELSRAQALLGAAGNFFQVWAQLIGGQEGGENYTMRGVATGPVLAVDRGKVVVHG